MNITSLLITFAGILFILALYLVSRITQNKLPKNHAIMIPDLKDDEGNRFSSILDDIPATDGSTPQSNPVVSDAVIESNNKVKKQAAAQNNMEPTQNVLFISAKDEVGLDGNLVLKALNNNGLVFGDMDIYHYFVKLNEEAKTSLFRVANGMKPWTLKEEDLQNNKLAGLSVVLLTPSKINDIDALKTFVNITKKIAHEVNAEVKNQQQQPLTNDDELNLINSAK